MRLRFLKSCLAVLITASTGFCQDATVKPAEPVRSVYPDPNAPATARDIQILNPDGTPATDAKVVAVLATPGGIVDQDLKPRQLPKVDKQPLTELVNDNGKVTVSTNETMAIVASNEKGFLFLPSSAFGDTAKLRKWAHVELDVSTVPEDMRADITLNVVWTNSLQGMYVRPQSISTDGLQRRGVAHPEELEFQPDWRFDPMITWNHSVPVTNQSVRVPPGEVMVSLTSKRLNDEAQLQSEWLPGSCAVTVGLWQTPGGTIQHIALPEFGNVEGTTKSKTMSTLPDWSKSGSETFQFVLKQVWSAVRPPIPSPSGNNDDYFSRLSSDEGFKTRQDSAAYARTATSDGQFQFPFVPVGTYAIFKLIEMRKRPHGIPGQLGYAAIPLKPDGEGESLSIVVNAKNTTVVNVTELTLPAPVTEPFLEEPISASPSPLPAGAQIAYRPTRRMVDGKEVTQMVPYLVNPKQSEPTQFYSEVYGDDDLGSEQSRLFGTDDAPSTVPQPDAAATLIQNWLRSTKDPSDQTELRKLLHDHLQQEFDATQASRKAEVERLQRLLLQSVEWQDRRVENRDEIIQTRINELIQNSVTNTPAGR
ncbi:MAG: hypothetical protein U0936_07790 [Planctomycetaceae bacterium]